MRITLDKDDVLTLIRTWLRDLKVNKKFELKIVQKVGNDWIDAGEIAIEAEFEETKEKKNA